MVREVNTGRRIEILRNKHEESEGGEDSQMEGREEE